MATASAKDEPVHDPIDERLARIRGDAAPRPQTARTLAALTRNPGCGRRAVVDAAGVDKLALAARVGFPARFGQSPFAIARGVAFEARLKERACSALVDLFQETLGLTVAGVDYVSCERASPAQTPDQRAAHSVAALVRHAGDVSGRLTIVDHPLLTVDVAGTSCHLEPDLLLCHGGSVRLVEIKSFAVVDGQADGGKVAAAAIQSAAYLLALRQALAAAGAPGADRVRSEVVLVCPENFSNRPTATVLDLRRQLIVLEHQFRRLAQVRDLLAGLPADLTLDLTIDVAGGARRSDQGLRDDLARILANYRPECLEHCELAYFCRDEASGSTAALGASVREALGGVDTLAEVLELAEGLGQPAEDQEEVADLLRAAASLYAEGLRSAGSPPRGDAP